MVTFLCLTQLQWLGIETIVLTITLIFVASYTLSTGALAKVSGEDFGLRRKPIVAITCLDQSEFLFRTQIINLSNVHAKMRVRASIKIDGKELKIWPAHHYSGALIWEVQAGLSIQGHLNMALVLEQNGFKDYEMVKRKNMVQVSLESWVINFYDSNQLFNKATSRNPKVQWDWNTNNQVWVPEVSPE